MSHTQSERALNFVDELIAIASEGGDADGAEIQKIAQEHGLLEEYQATEACGKNCSCVEVTEFPTKCFRKTYRKDAATAPQVPATEPEEMSPSKIFRICDAYESGMGHGLQRDGHSKGPYSNAEHNEAYEIGYKLGEERSAPQVPAEEKDETNWKRVAEVQNAKLLAITNSPNGFEILREVMDRYKKLDDAQVPAKADSKDTERLDFLLDSDVKVTYSGGIGWGGWNPKQGFMSGWNHNTPRDAIDAAIAAAKDKP